jgi:4'-phosphopantetheinyl transferase EntD
MRRPGTPMMSALLPAAVTVVEAFDDSVAAPLFPAEEAAVAGRTGRRRREFATARRCARAALAAHGFPPSPLPAGERGQPVWPAGVVGSITHCPGYRAAAVGRADRFAAIGVDAEPHLPLRDGVLALVALASERRRLAELAAGRPAVCWDRLLFSAKESVYKAWYPLTGRWLDFREADVVFDAAAGTFAATVLVDAPAAYATFTGRYATSGGLLVTATTVPARG